MKKNREFLPSILIALNTSFMLAIFEPIIMYANNIEDFWFDLSDIIGALFLALIIIFLSIIIVFLIFYLLGKKKKTELYENVIFIGSLIFLYLYIHGNFLASWLPSLDGESIDWLNPIPNIISIILFVVLVVAYFVFKKHTNLKKIINTLNYVMISVFMILGVSLMSTIFTSPIFETKEVQIFATKKNINNISNKQNFLILLLDTIESTQFNTIIESKEEFKNTFSDFTYYPDTLAGYPYTINSVPLILTGKWNENKTELASYSTDAFNNSPFFAKLQKLNYNANFYNYEFVWNDEKALQFDNIVSTKEHIKIGSFLKQEAKYVLFKYLPYPLKFLSHIEGMDFAASRVAAAGEYERYEWYDDLNYINLCENQLNHIDQKYFQYLHIEGAHPPFIFNSNFERINGTYEDKLVVSMTIIEKYINRLKENDSYDNSVIIIMSDHGYQEKRQNPILYIKGLNEKHSEMQISDKAVSHGDLIKAFEMLLDGGQGSDIFSDIEQERERRFLWHTGEKHIIEYKTTGKAWETEELVETGRIFDL